MLARSIKSRNRQSRTVQQFLLLAFIRKLLFYSDVGIICIIRKYFEFSFKTHPGLIQRMFDKHADR